MEGLRQRSIGATVAWSIFSLGIYPAVLLGAIHRDAARQSGKPPIRGLFAALPVVHVLTLLAWGAFTAALLFLVWTDIRTQGDPSPGWVFTFVALELVAIGVQFLNVALWIVALYLGHSRLQEAMAPTQPTWHPALTSLPSIAFGPWPIVGVAVMQHDINRALDARTPDKPYGAP